VSYGYMLYRGTYGNLDAIAASQYLVVVFYGESFAQLNSNLPFPSSSGVTKGLIEMRTGALNHQ
jgi:hypothetical protein